MHSSSHTAAPKVIPKGVSIEICKNSKQEFFSKSGGTRTKAYTTVLVPASATKCNAVDFNIGTELKIVHTQEKSKLLWCSLLVSICSAVVLGLIVLQLESKLCTTNHKVEILHQQMRWMVTTCGQLNRNMLGIRLSKEKSEHKNNHRRKPNISENDGTAVQFSDTDMNVPSDTDFNDTSSVNLTSYVVIDHVKKLIPENVPKSNRAYNTSNSNLSIVSASNSSETDAHELDFMQKVNTSSSYVKKAGNFVDNLPLIFHVYNQPEVDSSSGVNSTNMPSVDPNTEEMVDVVYLEDFIEDEEESDEGGSTRAGRAKRSNRRGKHSGMKSPNNHRGRHRKKNINRGPVAAHFKGGVPETFIQDGGLVAPWFPDSAATENFALSSYQFRAGKGVVEVTEGGLYLLYAQVYYLTSDALNGFSINIQQAGLPDTPVAYCSTNAFIADHESVTEASCYTSVVRYLNATTQVSVKQRDRNRRMILRDGYSFLGLVRLNSQQPGKERRGN